MKKFYFIFLILGLFRLSSAQPANSSWSFGFGVSYPRFVSTDLKSSDENLGGYLSIQRNFSEHVAFRLEVSGYFLFGNIIQPGYVYSNGSAVPVGKEKVATVLASGNFDLVLYAAPCSPVSPYFFVGLGAAGFRPYWSDVVNPNAELNTGAEINAGFGSEWNLKKTLKLKTELSFHSIDSKLDGIVNDNREGWLGSRADVYAVFDLGLNYYFSLGEPSKLCGVYDGISTEQNIVKPATREDVEEIIKANLPKEIVKEVVVEKPVEKVGVAPLESGWRLSGISFEPRKAKITTESFPILYNAYLILEGHPEIKIEIQGHTDNVGDDEYNRKLSESRAKAVYDYLVRRGIDPSRLSVKGYGESKPLADNTSAENRALNRRIEFKIVK